MRNKIAIAAILILTTVLFTGCISNEAFLRVSELTKQIQVLEGEAQEKLKEAEAGDLTITEALAWVRHANETIAATKDEITDLKKSENVGWIELIGAALLSMAGGGGLVRAWRGPSHKNGLTKPTT